MEDSIDIVDCFSMEFFDYHLDCSCYLFHRCGILHDFHLCQYCNFLDHHHFHVDCFRDNFLDLDYNDCLNCFGNTMGFGLKIQAIVPQIHQLVVVDD